MPRSQEQLVEDAAWLRDRLHQMFGWGLATWALHAGYTLQLDKDIQIFKKLDEAIAFWVISVGAFFAWQVAVRRASRRVDEAFNAIENADVRPARLLAGEGGSAPIERVAIGVFVAVFVVSTIAVSH